MSAGFEVKRGKLFAADGDFDHFVILRLLSLPERSQLMCLGGVKFCFPLIFHVICGVYVILKVSNNFKLSWVCRAYLLHKAFDVIISNN